MTAAENKRLLQQAFAEMARGNSKPFVDLWADDFCWTVTGSTKWSKTYSGKRTVLRELMGPLFSNFATQYTNTAHRFIAEDDYVAIECRGQVTTKSGQPYNNTYCYICRLEDGRLKELTEYMDTSLALTVLRDPEHGVD
jgi:ketosteroid isomerase-like protein